MVMKSPHYNSGYLDLAKRKSAWGSEWCFFLGGFGIWDLDRVNVIFLPYFWNFFVLSKSKQMILTFVVMGIMNYYLLKVILYFLSLYL